MKFSAIFLKTARGFFAFSLFFGWEGASWTLEATAPTPSLRLPWSPKSNIKVDKKLHSYWNLLEAPCFMVLVISWHQKLTSRWIDRFDITLVQEVPNRKPAQQWEGWLKQLSNSWHHFIKLWYPSSYIWVCAITPFDTHRKVPVASNNMTMSQNSDD